MHIDNNHKIPIIKSALIITVIGIISRVLGLLREAVIAAVFGVGAVTDAYAVAVRTISTTGLVAFVYLTIIFVPTYVRVREDKGDTVALGVTNNSLGVSLTVNAFLMLVLWFVAPVFVGLTGFDEGQSDLAVTAVRIISFQLPLMAFINLFIGYLNARKSFIGPAAIGLLMNVVFISVCIIAGTASGIVGLSIAAVLGFVGQLCTLIYWLIKEKYRYKFSVRFNTPEIRNDILLLLPALLGGGLSDIKAWIDTIIATNLGIGAPAAINFSVRLLGFVTGLIVIPIAGIVYTYMSEHATKNDIPKMLVTLWQTVRVILFIVTPIVVIAMLFSFDVVNIVFERGEFTPEATILTGTALMWLLPGLLGISIYTFLIRFFYALKDTKTPMLCSGVAIIVNIILSLWLSGIMGIGGLTLATSISGIFTAILLLIFLRHKIGALGFSKTAIDILKMAVCAIPCGLAAWGIGYLLAEHHAIIRFGVSTIAGGGVYIIAAFLAKEMVLKEAIQMAKIRITQKRTNNDEE